MIDSFSICGKTMKNNDSKFNQKPVPMIDSFSICGKTMKNNDSKFNQKPVPLIVRTERLA